MDTIEVAKGLDEVRQAVERFSNWGRWGADDELGTLNFIGSEQVLAATRCVRRGDTFSLAIPFDENGPQSGALGRTNTVHVMLQDGGDIASGAQEHLHMQYTDDAVYMVLQCGTQWDALSHYFFEGKMYNGYTTDDVTSRGALRNGIEKVRNKLLGRGVLLDVPRWRGVDWLDPGEPIHGADLVACAEGQGVSISTGDIVLVRTGQMARIKADGAWGAYCGGPAPGLVDDLRACSGYLGGSRYRDGHLDSRGLAERGTGRVRRSPRHPDRRYGDDTRRDLRHGGTRSGLRRGSRVHVPARRAAPSSHWCRRFAPQSHRCQVARGAHALRRKNRGSIRRDCIGCLTGR